MPCPHCNSLFLKTLEVRISINSDILYKKRCKRCKQKALFRRPLLSAVLKPLSLQDWLAGRKVSLNAVRAQIFVSEYSKKISRPAERQATYLQTIQQAEESHYAKNTPTVG